MSVATSPPRPAPTSAPGVTAARAVMPLAAGQGHRFTLYGHDRDALVAFRAATDTQAPSHPATRPPSHPGTRPSRHPGIQPPGHPGIQPPGHPGTRASRHPAIQAPGHPAIQAPGHPGIRASGHPGTRAPGHPGTRAPGHPGAWVRGKHSNGPAAVALAEHAATAAISVCVRRSARHARTPRRHATTGVSVTRMSGAAAAGLVVRTRPRPWNRRVAPRASTDPARHRPAASASGQGPAAPDRPCSIP